MHQEENVSSMRTEEDKSEPSTGANNDYFGSAGEVPIAKSENRK